MAQWSNARLVIGGLRVRSPANRNSRSISSPELSFCADFFFSTKVANRRPLLFCQKCRWQNTAKHTYTLSVWTCTGPCIKKLAPTLWKKTGHMYHFKCLCSWLCCFSAQLGPYGCPWPTSHDRPCSANNRREAGTLRRSFSRHTDGLRWLQHQPHPGCHGQALLRPGTSGQAATHREPYPSLRPFRQRPPREWCVSYVRVGKWCWDSVGEVLLGERMVEKSLYIYALIGWEVCRCRCV